MLDTAWWSLHSKQTGQPLHELFGATRDEKFHAFDKDTGELLWQATLPAGGYATPCTYAVNGRQYLVIAAGGAGKPGTRAGDQFIAFALPEE